MTAPLADSIHVQMHDGDTFCIEARGRHVPAVRQESWHEEPEVVQKATCPECLLRLYMLGDSARLKLELMGMRVEVKDVTPEEMIS